MPTNRFLELYDLQGSPAPGTAPADSRIVYSALRRGEARSGGDVLALKYVHQGTERYGFGRESFAVKAGQMLLVPGGIASEVSIVRDENRPTIGMCMFLERERDPNASDSESERPILLPAKAFSLGRALAAVTGKLSGQARPDASQAEALLGFAERGFEDFAADIGDAVDALTSVRPRTRWSIYRRLSAARAHLHETLDRQVPLSETARMAGMSQFQFARDFRACFGAPPARYHRALRLEAARRELAKDELSCIAIAHTFGFSDASSFGRAFRARFGHSPVRSLRSCSER